MGNEMSGYGELLTAIKARIRQAQVKATLSANAEMILTYWDIGRMIAFYRACPNIDSILPQPVAELS